MNAGEYEVEPLYAVVDEDLCTSCGICVTRCPYTAITIKDRKAKTPAKVKRAGYQLGYVAHLDFDLFREVGVGEGVDEQEVASLGGGVAEVAELHRVLGRAAGGQTEAYFRMAASAINARSREFSSLRSMQDAGIEKYEWSSVLDSNTTEACRFLDGQIFSVKGALDRYAAADALEDPTDIKYEMPWFYDKPIRGGEHDGKMGIFMNQREGMVRVAVVEKAGFGQRDTIGTYSNTKSPKALEGMGMPACPGHGL